MFVLDLLAGRAIRRLVDEDSVHRGGRLESRSGIHHVTRGHALSFGGPGAERDERLACGDRDPHLELAFVTDRVTNCECRPDGALRIVLVRRRRPEEGHHRVTDELLDSSSAPLELRAQARMVGLEHGANVLGVHLLRA